MWAGGVVTSMAAASLDRLQALSIWEMLAKYGGSLMMSEIEGEHFLACIMYVVAFRRGSRAWRLRPSGLNLSSNRLRNFQVTPDFALIPTGTPLAVELAFAIDHTAGAGPGTRCGNRPIARLRRERALHDVPCRASGRRAQSNDGRRAGCARGTRPVRYPAELPDSDPRPRILMGLYCIARARRWPSTPAGTCTWPTVGTTR